MENFVYNNPVKVIFGEGKIVEVGKEAKNLGTKAMLVSYEKITYLQSAIDKIHKSLEENGISCLDFFTIQANPILSTARKGVALAKENHVDLVIGLGGGSVMDSAKIIASGVLYPTDIKDMIMLSHSDIQCVPPTISLPTIMIPTLPATGSEMNQCGVITDDETMRKSYAWADCLFPKVAIMDAEMTKTLPPYQTACGAYDIIAHVTEAYLNADTSFDSTVLDKMQEGVIQAVFESLDKVWENPNDLQARGNLMWEASIALNGWLTSGTFAFTPMHQMGHVLSANFQATHGATLACMMPAWMRYMADRKDNIRYKMFAKNIFGTEDIKEASDIFESQMKEHGVQTRISLFGVKECDLERLTNEVVAVSFGADGKLNGHPKMTKEDIYNLYKLAL